MSAAIDEPVRARSRRMSGAPAAVALLALGLGCAPVSTVPATTGSAEIDSEAAPGVVRLYWFTSTKANDLDFPRAPDGPPIARVALERSTTGASSGYSIVSSSDRDGVDSATVTGSSDGRFYWFRVSAFDVAGRLLVRSAPVMTSPGPVSTSLDSFPVFANGRISWSPGGDSLLYVDASAPGVFRLSILDLGTRATTTLLELRGDAWMGDARWNADASVIAYDHTPSRTYADLDYRVHTLARGDTAMRAVSPGTLDEAPAWGADGWIYFCRHEDLRPGSSGVWRVRDGDPASLELVADSPAAYKTHPAVGGNGSEVVYEAWGDGQDYLSAGLYVVATGNAGVPLLARTEGRRDVMPEWDADGRHVVFISTRSGHSEVWSVDRVSGALAQITRGPRSRGLQIVMPSRDGSRLAVIEGRPTDAGVRGTLRILRHQP